MVNKILVLDIETRPAVAYVWRTFKENIGYEQVLEPGGMICFAAKFVDDPEVHFYSEWTHGHAEMVRKAHELISEADAVVTYNGDKFDLPKLQGEFLLDGLAPPPPVTSIDVIKHIRKMGFLLNRLAFIGPLLRVGQKVKHEGFELWANVLKGDEKAQKKMEKYNIQDVVLLEKLYKKILPYIKNHPHLGKEARGCGACGSNKVQSRGHRRTKYFRIQRLQCTSCGSWQDGTREKV
jgi:RNase_H superfamily